MLLWFGVPPRAEVGSSVLLWFGVPPRAEVIDDVNDDVGDESITI